MPTQPDLTPWPALIAAVAQRWPDAPKLPGDFKIRPLPMSLVVPGDSPVRIYCTSQDSAERLVLPTYAAEGVLVRWATEVGAWWTGLYDYYSRVAASAKPATLDKHAAAIAAIVTAQ